MSDSVGSVHLGLDVEANLDADVQKEAAKIVNMIKKSLGVMNENMFSGFSDSFEKMMAAMTESIRKQTEASKKIMASFINDLQAMAKNMKLTSPSMVMPDGVNESTPTEQATSANSTRGPPRVKVPKPMQMDTEFDASIAISQMQAMERELDNVNAMIENQQGKLEKLKGILDSTWNKTSKNGIEAQMLKTENTINKLIAKSDQLGFTLSALDRKQTHTANSTKNMGGKLLKLIAPLNTFKSSMKDLGNHMNSASQAGNMFSKISNKIHNGNKQATQSTNAHSMSLKRLVSSFLIFSLIFPIVSRGVMALFTSLGQSLMANQEFANSFAQIRTNLTAAFMPIYEAILPALNALMSTLAQVTAYIATFISALFGKTYSSSIKAAQGLTNAKDAMGAYGTASKQAAKDATKALMGFDEINKLDDKSNDAGGGDGGGAPAIVPTNIDTSQMTVIEGMANRIKKVLAQIWQPFQQAWNAEGQNTVNAAKYALSSIIGLLGAIGTSMLTVWTNGTGTTMLTLVLQIFQEIFGLIGDIASSLKVAWNNGGIGTKIMQGVADTITNLLKLIKGIGTSLRNAWGVIGIPLSNTLMKVLESTVSIIKTMSDALMVVWDNGGSYLFEQIIILGAKIVEIAGYIYTQFVTPFVEWFYNLLAPAVGFLYSSIGTLLSAFSGLIDWLLTTGKPVLDTIVVVFSSLALAFGIVKTAILAHNVVMGIWSALITVATTLGTAFGTVMVFITSPIGLVVAAIAAVIAIGYLLVNNWDTICQVATNVWGSIQGIFQNFDNWLSGVFATDWSRSFGFIGDIVNGLLASVSNVWSSIKGIFRGIIDFVQGVFTGNWSQAWNGVVSIFKNIVNGIGGVFSAPLNAAIGLVNGAIGGLNSISVDIPDWVPIFGGDHFGLSIPKIPYLAKGGVVDQSTLAMIGEAGKEAVVPLENNLGWLDTMASLITSKMPNIQPTLAFAGSSDYESFAPKESSGKDGKSLDDVIRVIEDLKQKFDEVKQTIREKDNDVYIDGESIKDDTVNRINKDTRKNGKCPIEI